MAADRYYTLQRFFLSRFHPDWRLDAPTADQVAREFVASEDSEYVSRVMRELRELLDEGLPEDQLHELLTRDYSLFFDPWKREVTMEEWLRDLLRSLESVQ